MRPSTFTTVHEDEVLVYGPVTSNLETRSLARPHKVGSCCSVPSKSLSTEGVAPAVTQAGEKKPKNADPLLVNLLVTCKLLYREARPILYGENRFDIRLDTARHTLAALHQRSRGIIHSLRITLPPGNEALERFAELVRLNLRYCWRLRTFTINMTTSYEYASHINIYANAFDNLRWLPKGSMIVLEGKVDPEIEKVIQLKATLAKSLDEVSLASQLGARSESTDSATSECICSSSIDCE